MEAYTTRAEDALFWFVAMQVDQCEGDVEMRKNPTEAVDEYVSRLQRAKFIAMNEGGGTVSQVSEKGFYLQTENDTVPRFRPWPRSEVAGPGDKFGRVEH